MLDEYPGDPLPGSPQTIFAGKLGELTRCAIAALAVPFISTALWWLHTRSTIYFRGWVDGEYLILLAVAMLIPSSGMIALLTVQLTVALIEPIAHLYYYSPADAIVSLRYLLFLPVGRLTCYATLLLIYAFCCAWILRVSLGTSKRPYAKHKAATLLVFVGFLSAYDMAIGRHVVSTPISSMFGNPDLRRCHTVRAPVLSLLHTMYLGALTPANSSSRLLESALSRASLVSEVASHQDIVLVLTESWGLARDQHLNLTITQPYDDPAVLERYHVEKGTVPFLGATTAGETRELCGDSHGRSTFGLPAGYFASCWPMQLTNSGYSTLAVHGFTPSMFSRSQWYQQMGFNRSVFLPELERDGAEICDGAFPGACDADVAHWIGQRLLEPHKLPLFVHWVTLNTHLPFPSSVIQSHTAPCMALGIADRPILCTWFSRIFLVHQSVAALAADPSLHSTVFVIVGDHAPPFMDSALRERFSQTSVPYIVLIPKSIHEHPQSIALAEAPHPHWGPRNP